MQRIIVQSVNDKDLNIIEDSTTAKEMLKSLENCFQGRRGVTKLNLQRKSGK